MYIVQLFKVPNMLFLHGSGRQLLIHVYLIFLVGPVDPLVVTFDRQRCSNGHNLKDDRNLLCCQGSAFRSGIYNAKIQKAII